MHKEEKKEIVGIRQIFAEINVNFTTITPIAQTLRLNDTWLNRTRVDL